MKIINSNRKTDFLMSLRSGDVFKYNDYYFVAGDIIAIDNYRECFNLTNNCIAKVRFNPIVEYWHSNEAILKLYDNREDQM